MAQKGGIVSIPASGGEAGLNRYLGEIKKFPILSPEEEYMFAKRWREHGDTDAAAKLVNSHLRLVAKIAMGYRGYGLPVSELISEGNIGRHPVQRKKMTVLARGGKPALTRYRVLKSFGGVASLVECRLATGRTHQIRVHLASIGHPLLGDPVYGRATPARLQALSPRGRAALAGFKRQALHAWLLGFKHPVTEETLRWESALPPDMGFLISSLESI
jgi:hypothetical protein